MLLDHIYHYQKSNFSVPKQNFVRHKKKHILKLIHSLLSSESQVVIIIFKVINYFKKQIITSLKKKKIRYNWKKMNLVTEIRNSNKIIKLLTRYLSAEV